MRRPWIIAAAALLGLIVVLVLLITLTGRDDQDKLSDEAVAANEAAAAAAGDPEQRCAEQGTYDRIKRELFRRAAAVRGSDQPVFEKLAAYAVLRAEAPILRGENSQVGSVDCSAYVTLDLPPGVAVAGGRRSLNAEIGYAVQPAADGSGRVVTLTNADSIITPLATLARVGASLDQGLSEGSGNLVEPPADDADGPKVVTPPAPAAEPSPPPAPAPTATARPSFNCANARTRGELAVCDDAGLAALDRNMAAEYRRTVAAATPAQRRLLVQTRDRFLGYRDRCDSRGCMTDAYLGRIREIRDIMAGRWRAN